MAINYFVPTVWSEVLLEKLGQRYVGVANCNRDFEGEIKGKGSVVRICGINDIVISDYTKNTNISAPSTISDRKCDLTINQAKYFNFQIDDVDRAQMSPRVMGLAMRNVAASLAAQADAYVYSLVSAAGTTITEEVTAENIIETLVCARTCLMSQNAVDPSDVVIEISPEIASILYLAKMTLATDNREIFENGCIGSICGCKVYVSNNIASTESGGNVTYKCLVRTKRAIAFAEQLSEIDAYRPELRFADAVKGLYLYGAKVVYPDELVALELTM